MKNLTMRYILLIMSLLLGSCSAKAGYFLSSFVHPLSPSKITFEDSGESPYYAYTIGPEDKTDTFLFFFPGSGCSSLKYYLRQYLKGLEGNIRVFALQKRFVSHNTTGVFGCPEKFDEFNYFNQWVSDYGYFAKRMLATAPKKPLKVLFLGVSEGAWPASAIASENTDITHLAIIGHGGMKMRDDLKLLLKKGNLGASMSEADIEAVYKDIFRDPDNTAKRFLGQTYKYWASVLDIDPLDHMLSLKIPIIVGMGEKDESVPVESAYYLKNKFGKAGKQNLTLVVYPDADHTLKDPSGESHRDDFLKLLMNRQGPQ